MREILFRGKRKDNGEWIYGGIYYQKADEVKEDAVYIIGGSLNDVGVAYEVIPETVGQCTGLKDKKSKKIFKGDIIYCKSRLDSANMVVIFECGQFRMILSENYYSYQTNIGFYDINCFDKEVIGNIYDNVELLKGK